MIQLHLLLTGIAQKMGEYIQLDDIILSSEGDGSNLETTLDQMMTTASVIEYVARGTYWIGSGDETAMNLLF